MLRPFLFIIPSVTTGGAEIHAMIRLRELSRRGVPVRLMVLSESVDSEILARAGLPDDCVCRLRNPSATLDRAFLTALWRDLARASRYARQHGVGTVIAHLPPAHLFARLLFAVQLLRGRRLKLFQYHHSEERTLNPTDTWGKRLFFALNQSLAWACDYAHLHVSERVLADVAGGGVTRRNAVVHNSCDMDSPGNAEGARAIIARVAPAAASGKQPFRMLLPGRLLVRKGHILLIGAFARLVERYGLRPDEVRLLFAGDGPARPEIERAIAASGLERHVSLLGSIPHADLLALYRMVDLVVIPSLVEGFGNVAIEALSRGALVLASDAAGLNEIVRPGENGLQFPTGDEDALYEWLRGVWERRGEPLIDRAAARADIRARFGLDAHIDRIIGIIGAGSPKQKPASDCRRGPG